jgi:broad specificity phosphatase PhoE
VSAVGRAEAAAAAWQLVDQGIEVIYTSPLLRTRQTAEIIQQQLPVPLYEDELLSEFDLGSGEGATEKEYQQRELWRQSGETLVAAGDRVLRFLEKVKKEGRYRTLAVVSHETPVVMAFLNLAGKTAADYSSLPFPTGGYLKLAY